MERTTPKADTKNLTVRITSALVFGLFFFSLLWFGDRSWAPWAYFGLLALAVAMGVHEMTLMARVRGFNPSQLSGVLVAWGILAHFNFATGNHDP
jgi:CDP-diglyceride synthetase